MILKRALKPVIPVAFLNRYRLMQHSRIVKRDLARYRSDLTFLADLHYDDISFGTETAEVIGASLDHCIRIIKKHTTIKGKSILIVGCGNGREIHRWMKEKPSRIIAIEYLDYREDWKDISYPNVKIVQGDIRSYELDEEVDIVTSKAVLEHISGLPAAFSSLVAPLKRGGYFWADLGPLYFTWGGAHAPLGYDHLLMSEAEFGNLLNGTGYEEAQTFWKHGLFSKLAYDQYMSCFAKHLEARYEGLEFSREALSYRESDRYRFDELSMRYGELDLLLKSIFYLGRKKDG